MERGSGIVNVFHGSDHIVKVPVYLGGKPDNDYGNGFYVTEDENSAGSWAALNGSLKHSIVNRYELNLNGLNVLDLNDYGVLAWIAEVVSNRGINHEAAGIVAEKLAELYKQDTSRCDIIMGYRADDSYTQVIEAFLLNQLNISEVKRLFYKGSLGNQIFLKSAKAFEQIQWINSYEVDSKPEYRGADLYARREVGRFLSKRMKAVLLEGYQVTGVTAQYALQNKLLYQKEGDFYE